MELLPNEIVREICQVMDVKSLSKFIRTSKKNRKICISVLNQRINNLIDIIIDKLYRGELYEEDTQLIIFLDENIDNYLIFDIQGIDLNDIKTAFKIKDQFPDVSADPEFEPYPRVDIGYIPELPEAEFTVKFYIPRNTLRPTIDIDKEWKITEKAVRQLLFNLIIHGIIIYDMDLGLIYDSETLEFIFKDTTKERRRLIKDIIEMERLRFIEEKRASMDS